MSTNKVFGVPPGTIVIPATGDDSPGWGNNLAATLNTIADYVNFQPYLYSVGTAYYGGATPTITCTGLSSAEGFIRILNTTNGGIWARLSLKVTLTAPTTSVTVNLSGITSIYQHAQPVDVATYNTSTLINAKATGATMPAGSTGIIITHTTSFDELYIGGEFMLATYADWQYR